ncbi:MAG: hypothetical protein ACD_3C00152G0002 [uncultured bacterium (gcode 4)]|uniref:Uncharacterized protein n=1 Tax=uncultured bacterium (gcode 4) TaxID=1234023 RepID=K2GC34_9BACT|nr:MAG: hypothetical protein ACD_3C00152G0002 [uncultured bacterium (gcode 4)]
MSNIAKWLSVFNASAGTYPKPDSSVSITASWVEIWRQWYAGATVLNMIKISNGWKDPLDTSTYYTFSTNVSQSKFQILWFLEDWSNSALSYLPFLSGEWRWEGWVNADPSSYSWRFVITKWDQLWVLLSSWSMVPVQTSGILSWTWIDIINTTWSYMAVYDRHNSVSWTWLVLSSLNPTSSCKKIKDTDPKSLNGTYTINPLWWTGFSVFCDMTTDGWWWTKILYWNSTLSWVSDNLIPLDKLNNAYSTIPIYHDYIRFVNNYNDPNRNFDIAISSNANMDSYEHPWVVTKFLTDPSKIRAYSNVNASYYSSCTWWLQFSFWVSRNSNCFASPPYASNTKSVYWWLTCLWNYTTNISLNSWISYAPTAWNTWSNKMQSWWFYLKSDPNGVWCWATWYQNEYQIWGVWIPENIPEFEIYYK